jgi:hypothetical protein
MNQFEFGFQFLLCLTAANSQAALFNLRVLNVSKMQFGGYISQILEAAPNLEVILARQMLMPAPGMRPECLFPKPMTKLRTLDLADWAAEPVRFQLNDPLKQTIALQLTRLPNVLPVVGGQHSRVLCASP